MLIHFTLRHHIHRSPRPETENVTNFDLDYLITYEVGNALLYTVIEFIYPGEIYSVGTAINSIRKLRNLPKIVIFIRKLRNQQQISIYKSYAGSATGSAVPQYP